jgi:hypothetical protein
MAGGAERRAPPGLPACGPTAPRPAPPDLITSFQRGREIPLVAAVAMDFDDLVSAALVKG